MQVSGVAQVVSIKPATESSGKLYVVATPIGNLDDISRRAQQTLSGVDVVAAEDTRHTRKLLSFLSIDKPLLSLHEHNEREKTDRLMAKLLSGQDIALVSDAGTPLISDPGYPLVTACRQQGVSVIPVPGPSALIAALSVSGLPTDSFRFCGFPPRQSGKRKEFFKKFYTETATLIFYESSHRIMDCLKDAVEIFGADRQACVARELTKLYETVLTDSLGVLQDKLEQDENQTRGEFVLMVQGLDHSDQPTAGRVEADTLLKALLDDLPVKKAAAITAQLTGLKKNDLYKKALDFKK